MDMSYREWEEREVNSQCKCNPQATTLDENEYRCHNMTFIINIDIRFNDIDIKLKKAKKKVHNDHHGNNIHHDHYHGNDVSLP